MRAMHLVRYYGAYSNRGRTRCQDKELMGQGVEDEVDDLSLGEKRSRASWARLLRKIYESDPLLCPKCGDTMKIVSVITEPEVIDKTLRHRKRAGTQDIFEARAPPSASAS